MIIRSEEESLGHQDPEEEKIGYQDVKRRSMPSDQKRKALVIRS
jgi:hypothetical protein